MNKSDLITALAKKEKLTEIEATRIVNLIFDGFSRTLVKDGRIELRGFGAFNVRKYKSYTGRNPKTGTNIQVKPKRSSFFKVGKDIKKK